MKRQRGPEVDRVSTFVLIEKWALNYPHVYPFPQEGKNIPSSSAWLSHPLPALFSFLSKAEIQIPWLLLMWATGAQVKQRMDGSPLAVPARLQ